MWLDDVSLLSVPNPRLTSKLIAKFKFHLKLSEHMATRSCMLKRLHVDEIPISK